jgi:ABC-type transport system involved in multi-copper enzyme maturation permease subunit
MKFLVAILIIAILYTSLGIYLDDNHIIQSHGSWALYGYVFGAIAGALACYMGERRTR